MSLITMKSGLMRLNVLRGIFPLSPETFYSFLCDVNGAISNWSCGIYTIVPKIAYL